MKAAAGEVKTYLGDDGDADFATDADGADDVPVTLCPVGVGGVDLHLKHGLCVMEVGDDLVGAVVHAANGFVLLAKELDGEEIVLRFAESVSGRRRKAAGKRLESGSGGRKERKDLRLGSWAGEEPCRRRWKKKTKRQRRWRKRRRRRRRRRRTRRRRTWQLVAGKRMGVGGVGRVFYGEDG